MLGVSNFPLGNGSWHEKLLCFLVDTARERAKSQMFHLLERPGLRQPSYEPLVCVEVDPRQSSS